MLDVPVPPGPEILDEPLEREVIVTCLPPTRMSARTMGGGELTEPVVLLEPVHKPQRGDAHEFASLGLRIAPGVVDGWQEVQARRAAVVRPSLGHKDDGPRAGEEFERGARPGLGRRTKAVEPHLVDGPRGRRVACEDYGGPLERGDAVESELGHPGRDAAGGMGEDGGEGDGAVAHPSGVHPDAYFRLGLTLLWVGVGRKKEAVRERGVPSAVA